MQANTARRRNTRRSRMSTLLSRYVVVSMFAIGLTTWHSAASLNEGLDASISGLQTSPEGTQRLEVLGESEVAVDSVLSQTVVELTNRERVRNRRRAYVRTSELDAAAAEYAATLTSGRLVHATNLGQGLSGNWSKLGENLGRGRDVLTIHQALLASPTHRANILDIGFTQIGVAVIRTDAGLVMVQRFRQG